MADKQQVSYCLYNKEYFIASPAALNDLRQFLKNLNRPGEFSIFKKLKYFKHLL